MDILKDYLKRYGYGENLPTIPKLRENATSEERIDHYVKMAGYGFPDEKPKKSEPITSLSGNDIDISHQNSLHRNIDWQT